MNYYRINVYRNLQLELLTYLSVRSKSTTKYDDSPYLIILPNKRIGNSKYFGPTKAVECV